MIRIINIAIIILLTFSCSVVNDKENIVGKWKGVDSEDGILEFKEDGGFNAFDENGNTAFPDDTNITISYQTIKEVELNQLYIIIIIDDKSEKIPLGIYKIENNKLILREPIEYHKSLGGIDMGVSKYEIPENFNGILTVFNRVD